MSTIPYYPNGYNTEPKYYIGTIGKQNTEPIKAADGTEMSISYFSSIVKE